LNPRTHLVFQLISHEAADPSFPALQERVRDMLSDKLQESPRVRRKPDESARSCELTAVKRYSRRRRSREQGGDLEPTVPQPIGCVSGRRNSHLAICANVVLAVLKNPCPMRPNARYFLLLNLVEVLTLRLFWHSPCV
jgi:hypothetical protein